MNEQKYYNINGRGFVRRDGNEIRGGLDHISRNPDENGGGYFHRFGKLKRDVRHRTIERWRMRKPVNLRKPDFWYNYATRKQDEGKQVRDSEIRGRVYDRWRARKALGRAKDISGVLTGNDALDYDHEKPADYRSKIRPGLKLLFTKPHLHEYASAGYFDVDGDILRNTAERNYHSRQHELKKFVKAKAGKKSALSNRRATVLEANRKRNSIAQKEVDDVALFPSRRPPTHPGEVPKEVYGRRRDKYKADPNDELGVIDEDHLESRIDRSYLHKLDEKNERRYQRRLADGVQGAAVTAARYGRTMSIYNGQRRYYETRMKSLGRNPVSGFAAWKNTYFSGQGDYKCSTCKKPFRKKGFKTSNRADHCNCKKNKMYLYCYFVGKLKP